MKIPGVHQVAALAQEHRDHHTRGLHGIEGLALEIADEGWVDPVAELGPGEPETG